ncbi:MAG TPA: ATP-binding protein [Methylomirabilota bacterium]|nr:ATP-binding protein [Methylomirabilota bacterium]
MARALLGSVPDAVLVLKKDGTIEEYYEAKEGEFLLSSESMLGRRLKELLPGPTGQMVTHYLEKVFRTGQSQVFSFHHAGAGRMRVYEFRLAVSAATEAVALVRDVTDRELLEKEIVESSNRVQARIGQDLHDGLGQHLTGITFLSKALERKLAARSLPEAAEAAEIGRLVMGALSQTRNLAKGLFPVELQSNGLVPALNQLAETAEDLFQICCELKVAEGVAVNDPDASMHLFRLAQEAINNAVKHGKARSVFLTLQPEGDDRLVLRIEDDGIGIPPDRTQSGGLGLRIMNYRAQKLGGTIEIVPGPAGGTRVTCSFPLPDEMR